MALPHDYRAAINWAEQEIKARTIDQAERGGDGTMTADLPQAFHGKHPLPSPTELPEAENGGRG